MPPSRIFAARLMNAPCKYYFCLCTRQLSATLVLINNAKQSESGQLGTDVGDALWQRDYTMLRRVYLLGTSRRVGYMRVCVCIAGCKQNAPRGVQSVGFRVFFFGGAP